MSYIQAGASGGGGGGRTVLTGNATYYIRSDGNDSNNGKSNSAGGAWLTLQHAMDFISANIDFAGFFIFVIIGAGSFAGFGAKSTVGAGVLQFVGAGPASTTITNGPNDGVFNFGECITVNAPFSSILAIDQVTLVSTGTNTVSIFTPDVLVNIGDATSSFTVTVTVDLTNSPVYVFDVTSAGSEIIFSGGTLNVTGGGGTITSFYRSEQTAMMLSFCSVLISGNITVTAFAAAVQVGLIIFTGGTTITGGTVTGKRFTVNANALIDTANGGANFFPGNAAGTMSNGGVYI